MKTPITFILNVNDENYILVEKKEKKSSDIVFNVYDNVKERASRYSAAHFYDAFDSHIQTSVKSFLEKAVLNLTAIGKRTEKIDQTYDIFRDALKHIQKDPIKKPNLKSIKKSLIWGIDNYNQLTNLLPHEPEIDYLDEYNLVNEQELEKEKIYIPSFEERVAVKSIINRVENSKGIQRIKKYE